MPVKSPFVFFIISLLFINPIFGQNDELNSVVEDLKKSIQTVRTSKAKYEQIIRSQDVGIITLLRVETNSKGIKKDKKYEFNLADVDQYTVRTDTKRDLLTVNIGIKAEQKLIKSYEDGAVKSYEKELEIFVTDIDNGRAIVDIIKKGISPAEEIAEKKLSLKSYQDAISWLTENVKGAKANDKKYEFNVREGTVVGQIEMKLTTTDSKSRTAEQFVFNIADINPNSLQFKVSGSRFFLTLEIDQQRKLISYRKDGEPKPYKKDLEIIINNVEEARELRTAVELTIPMAKKELEGTFPDLDSKEKALIYLEKQISSFKNGEQTITQKFDPSCVTQITIVEKDFKKSVENIFEFNLIDLNTSTIDFDIKSKDVLINPLVQDKNKLIKHWKDGELMNYEEELSIYASSIENARKLTYALGKAIEFCKSDFKPAVPRGKADEKLEWIINNISRVSQGDKSYKQSLSRNESKPDKISYERIEVTSKNSSEELYEFNLLDVDPEKVVIDVSGKWVSLELNSHLDQKIFNYYKDGQAKNYQSSINIFVESIESARNLKIAFEEVVSELAND